MSIRRKGNGYEVRVYVGRDPTTGRKLYASKYVSDQEAGGQEKAEKRAKRIEADLIRQVETNTYVPPAQKSLAEHLDEWLEKEAKPNTKPRTYPRYEELVRVHIKPSLGAIRLNKLTPAHVVTLLAEKRKEGLSSRTCLHIYRVLHRALEVAVQWGLVGRNVCDAVRAPRADDEAPVGLTAEEVEALLKAAEGERLYPLLLTAVHTGMRQGELLGLRWADVDLKTGVALVRQALEKPGRRPVFTTPKNRKPRVVPLSAQVVEALKKVQAEQALERVFYGKDYEDYDLVFCQPNGRPLDGLSLTRWHFKRLLKKAGLPESIRFHDLRHTFVSRALQAGANPRAVSEIVGHYDPGFTLKRYAHALPQDMREAVRRLELHLNHRAAPRSPEV
ncbi:MAG TPA: site-specific integrase [Firmicutes bacterium]|nr:site-specific integrase [Bacillota bacterium]